ncbi:MAG: hypothetical protein KatS3mg063_1319 [Tepidiforma sp.]|uniref:right-handed parallel beta-helix repeat-containing protein n=1 Tax=Tepidiforma sp. TaxID=2682230 RepID=UPI0021DC3350|nr:right-handed parallel beta-helix repeat-containing protein [Tepidiforma sp.]GIW15466.1 MAG: hypothetical protein KatS3mg063_1319 [Tepidiforma sp.]
MSARTGLLLLVAVAAVLAGGGGWPPAARAAGIVTVTSTADAAGTCPHPSNCTLRAAIAAVNSGGPSTIRFDPAVFPAAAPAVISVGSSPLPPLTADGATIDGSGSGVILRSASASLSVPHDGLRVTGSGATIRGLAFEGFSGVCLHAEGTNATVGSPAAPNRFHDCGVAIRVAGAAGTVAANDISADPASLPDAIGILVSGSNVTIGGAGAARNTIDGTAVGVRVTGGSVPVAGVTIENNSFRRISSACVDLAAGTSGTTVRGNAFEDCGTGIVVAPSVEPAPVDRNSFAANTFSALRGLAIDLGADGLRNPPGQPPPGPNGWVAYPAITRATPSGIEGTTCPGCRVEIYLASHTPGGQTDYGTVPLGPPVTADASGRFSAAAMVSPGQWLVALATDAQGNTSEFSRPARVGSGAVVCGNVQLLPGWNHVAYFGSAPLILGDAFPSAESPAVTAIYQAVDGTSQYRRWLAATSAGRTLAALEPGQEYWFLATAPVTLPGGFSVSFPVPVTLQPGWNDLVYIGGSADPRDALASLEGKLLEVAKWDAGTQRWRRFGDGTAPAWTAGFDLVEACATYQVRVSETVTLQPLQP